MNFRKTSKGGAGGHFQSKNYVADFGNIKHVFLNMKLIQNKTHFEEGSSSHNSLRDGSRYQIGLIFGKVPRGILVNMVMVRNW